MANKYHINPATGKSGLCVATKRGCGFGEHFDTPEAAEQYVIVQEAKNNDLFTTKSRKQDNLDRMERKIQAELNSSNSNSRGGIADRLRPELSARRHNDSTNNSVRREQAFLSYAERNNSIQSARFSDREAAILKKYPVGSIVQLDRKYSPGPSATRARIVDVNSSGFTAIDTQTGKEFDLGKSAEFPTYDYRITTISKGAMSDDEIAMTREERAKQYRKEFDEKYDVGSNVQVISNMNYNAQNNGTYRVYEKNNSSISLQNVSTGETIQLRNNELDSNRVYSFVPADNTPNDSATNNSALQDYINRRSPYPTNGFGRNTTTSIPEFIDK